MSVYAVDENNMMVVVENEELLLLSAFGMSSALMIHIAQAIDEYPCLYPIQYTETTHMKLTELRKSRCALLTRQACKTSPIYFHPWAVSASVSNVSFFAVISSELRFARNLNHQPV